MLSLALVLSWMVRVEQMAERQLVVGTLYLWAEWLDKEIWISGV